MSRSNSHDFSGTSSKNPYDWLAPSWVSCVAAWGEMGGAPITSRLIMFFVQENVRMRYVKINRKGKTFRHWVADSVEIGFAVWCLRSWTMMLFDFFCVCGVECMMHSTYNTPLALRWLLVVPAGCCIASCRPLSVPPSHQLIAPACSCITSPCPLIALPSHRLVVPAGCRIASRRPLAQPSAQQPNDCLPHNMPK